MSRTFVQQYLDWERISAVLVITAQCIAKKLNIAFPRPWHWTVASIILTFSKYEVKIEADKENHNFPVSFCYPWPRRICKIIHLCPIFSTHFYLKIKNNMISLNNPLTWYLIHLKTSKLINKKATHSICFWVVLSAKCCVWAVKSSEEP